MTLPRVLVAEDHVQVAECLRGLLDGHCELVGIVHDGTSLVEAALHHRPDVIVADISMPGCDGLEALRRLRERGASAKVIMLTMFADREIAEQAIACGANGYIVKHAAADELLKAIADVTAGLTYITPFVSRPRPRR